MTTLKKKTMIDITLPALKKAYDVATEENQSYIEWLKEEAADWQGTSPNKTVYASLIDTPLGSMLVIADTTYLYLLAFTATRGLKKEMKRVVTQLNAVVSLGSTPIIDRIQKELSAYFNGTLSRFNTPYRLLGTPFEKLVWRALTTIPAGQTRSYRDMAKHIAAEQSYRALANANGKNQLAIIIPCHRVIRANGDLGGYAGGLSRKTWLIAHEKNMSP